MVASSLFCYHRLFNPVACLLFFLLLSDDFHGGQSNREEEIRDLQEPQPSNSATEEMSRFDEVMKMLMAYSNAPGAQLAVAKGGQLKYFKAFGVANRDNGEPVTTHHFFRHNSISKVITGTAILELVQEGKVSYGSIDYKNSDSYGGWVGSAGDLLRFVDHIDGLRVPAILNKEMVYAMLNAPMPANRVTLAGSPLSDHPRGLDVFVSVDKKSGKITSFQHSGGTHGSHSFVMRLMGDNITFAYVFNTHPGFRSFDYAAVGNLSQVATTIHNWPPHDLSA